MATVTCAAAVIFNNRHQMPSNKIVRLIYQPAEEGPVGAAVMIEEGCLTNIFEIYGYHNVPNFDEGNIRVCEGGFFAYAT
jgi:hippurate hydrolase